MCGIIGYAGYRDVVSVILKGLTNLEYRGYDSAGIAIRDNNEIKIYKTLGKLINLKNELEANRKNINNPTSGIGHIRWATHGSPTITNAHPHSCTCGNWLLYTMVLSKTIRY